MSDSKEKERLIEVERLRPGIFIRLEGVAWYRHPFLTSSFRIKDMEQVETIQSLGVKNVIYIPDKSLTSPIEKRKKEPIKVDYLANQIKEIPSEMYTEKKKRIEIYRKKKESIARAELKYTTSLEKVENMMRSIGSGNPQYLDEAVELSSELSNFFVDNSEAFMHVLNSQDDNNSTIYFHSLNVTVLSLILGKAAGLTRKEMNSLAIGSIFHDIGKSKVPKKILRKRGKLTIPELELIKKHPFYGVQILSKSADFPKDAMDIVYQHHERCDGKGYPRNLGSKEISKLAKISAITNSYDGMINMHDHSKSLSPYQALAQMYSKGALRFDHELMSIFIRCMGIYPPGTIVILNHDFIGLVISVNLKKPLLPSVVLYDSQVEKSESLILDLEYETEYEITGSISPAKLDKEVYEYLSPRTRITYFVDLEDN